MAPARLATILLSFTLFLSASPASGDSRTVEDERDQGGLRDIRWVRHSHGSAPRALRHSLRTYDRWGNRMLDNARIRFAFSVDDHRDIERLIAVRRKDGELRATMFEGAHPGGDVVGRVKVWRPSRRSLVVSFDSGMLGDGITAYRWKARFYPRVVDCPEPCGDKAPQSGLIRHRL